MAFELILKATFVNQLQNIPLRDTSRILHAIELLRRDPEPNGPQKKKLHGFQGDIYRLRVGDYRVIYSYSLDGNWITLLGVDNRKDVYRGSKLMETIDPLSPARIPDRYDELGLTVDAGLLVRLGIPQTFHKALIGCHTLEGLMEADVPELVRETVFEAISEPNYEAVLARQPAYFTGDLDQLRQYVNDKSFNGFVLLTPEQASQLLTPERARSLIYELKQSPRGEPYPRIDGTVFVSHSSADTAFSQILVRSLREKGAEVWFDQDNLASGPLRRAVETALETAQHFIVVMSPDAMKSTWVEEETDAALHLLRRGRLKTFLPIVVRQCEIPLLLERYKRIESPDGSGLTAEEAAEQVVQILSNHKQES